MFRRRCRQRRRSQLIGRLWENRLKPASNSGSESAGDSSTSNVDSRMVNIGRGDVKAVAVSPSWRRHPSTLCNASQRIEQRFTTGSCLTQCCIWSSSAMGGSCLDIEDRTEIDNEAADIDLCRRESLNETTTSTSTNADVAVRLLFGMLDVEKLETLVDLVCGRLAEEDGEAGGCVPLAIPDGTEMAPNIISCRLWRWPDLPASSNAGVAAMLRPLPSCSVERNRLRRCQSAGLPTTTVETSQLVDGHPVSSGNVCCCNPYHWSRLLEGTIAVGHFDQASDSMPPLPQSFVDRQLTADGRSRWCTIAYWELDRRVGPLYEVRHDRVDVFQRLARGSGLCLDLLQQQLQQTSSSSSGVNDSLVVALSSSRQLHCPKPAVHSRSNDRFDSNSSSSASIRRRSAAVAAAAADTVRRTRTKIGAGIVLSRELDRIDGDDDSSGSRGVWLYNRSQFPVFVCRSDTDSDVSRPAGVSTVERVLPGYAIRLFDADSRSPSTDVNRRWLRPTNTDSADRKSELSKSQSKDDGNGRSRDQQLPNGRRSAVVSFVKGWGHGYRRSSVTSCPCWIEIIVNENDCGEADCS